MNTPDLWLRFVLASLAVWRVTHMLVYEDGPGNALVRFRQSLGSGFWGRLMDCFYCLSVWISAAATPAAFPDRKEWLLDWLALSAAACLLDRIARDPVVVQTLNEGDSTHAMLRSEPGSREDAGAGHAS